MLMRQLGHSGIQVSALGFGCWPIGGHLVERGGYVGWGAGHSDQRRPHRRAGRVGVAVGVEQADHLHPRVQDHAAGGRKRPRHGIRAADESADGPDRAKPGTSNWLKPNAIKNPESRLLAGNSRSRLHRGLGQMA